MMSATRYYLLVVMSAMLLGTAILEILSAFSEADTSPTAVPVVGYAYEHVVAGDVCKGGVLMTRGRVRRILSEPDTYEGSVSDFRQVRVPEGDRIPFSGILWPELSYSQLREYVLRSGYNIDLGFTP